MVYDAARQRVVLFGGIDASGNRLGDTWEWNGTNWSQVFGASPGARTEHAMAYDSNRGETVLFGGTNLFGLLTAETWVYTGAGGWTLKSPATSPTARREHALAFDAPRNRVVLFGGITSAGADNQTWEWDGSAGGGAGNWVQQTPATPPVARSEHAIAFRPTSGGRITLFGGRAGTVLGDTWEWNGATKVWTQLTPATHPAARSGHAMAYHDPTTGTKATIAFGGGAEDHAPRSDTWFWSGTAWSVVAWGSPPSRQFFDMSVGPAGDGIGVYAFGGHTGGGIGIPRGDQWLWNGSTWTETFPATKPSERRLHRMVFDSARRVIVLFAGVGVIGPIITSLDDTWEFNGATWTQRPGPSPGPRNEHGMAFDSHRNITVMFGGSNFFGLQGSTWEWNGAAWTLRSSTGPAPRAGHSMAFDAARGVTVLFGGRDATPTYFTDTWEWNGATWTQRITATAPQMAAQNTLTDMVYDAARSRVVLQIAVGFPPFMTSETWEYYVDPATGSPNWFQRTPSPAGPPVTGHAMAYHPDRRLTVLFGGSTNGNFPPNTFRLSNETWDYGPVDPALVQFGADGCGPICDAAPGAGNLPWIGESFTTRVSNMPGNVSLALYYEATLLATPITISPGCLFRVTPTVAVPLTADPSGTATHTILLSVPPSAVGTSLFSQAIVATTPGTVSNVLDLVFGLK